MGSTRCFQAPVGMRFTDEFPPLADSIFCLRAAEDRRPRTSNRMSPDSDRNPGNQLVEVSRCNGGEQPLWHLCGLGDSENAVRLPGEVPGSKSDAPRCSAISGLAGTIVRSLRLP